MTTHMNDNNDLDRLLEEYIQSADPDLTLVMQINELVKRRKKAFANGHQTSLWKPGQKLKLFLAGYAGAGNTGADVRVYEMIRQFKVLFGEDQTALSLAALDTQLSRKVFGDPVATGVNHVEVSHLPKFLYEQTAIHHGVIACEGSMFKSNLSESMSMIMLGAMALGRAENKLAVGYGAEAGFMSKHILDFTVEHCKDTYVMCRNEPSQEILTPLGIRTDEGSDTAWTFEPAPAERARELLLCAGWDGKTPVLTICPVNPFWWPVKADIQKAKAMEENGEFSDLHYGWIMFHQYSQESQLKYQHYLNAIADAVNRLAAERSVFPVIIGMDRTDIKACRDLSALLATPPASFTSGDVTPTEIISILRHSSMLLSSRFHAIVCSMPGLVPSAGISYDERILNLMAERGHPHLMLHADAVNLEEQLFTILEQLADEGDQIAADSARVVVSQVKRMGEMGKRLLDETCRIYPEYPRPQRSESWEAHLPPLPKAVVEIFEKHD